MKRSRKKRAGFRWLPVGVSLLILVGTGTLILSAGQKWFTPAPHRSPLSEARPTHEASPIHFSSIPTTDIFARRAEPMRQTPWPPVPRVEPQQRPDPVQAVHGGPRIVVIIDDLGLNAERTRAIASLPAPVTMAFLPYGSSSRSLAREARGRGHEIMVHMPMEPLNAKADPGPNALRHDLPPAELNRRLRANLDALDGYDGVNNHMGSRLTASRPAMRMVMAELRRRGLFFIDSRTSQDSVAAAVAVQAGIPWAGRDVFLDHVETPEAVWASIRHAETIARKRGYVVVIGHPKPVTIEALEQWLPELKAQGFELVPASAVVGP